MSPVLFANGLVGLALFASVAASQPGRDPRLESRLDSRTYAVVTAIVDSARSSHIPVEPLIVKALEGASKGAPGPAIINAVRSVADALGQARRALGPESSDEEVKAGANAIRGGVPVRELERLRSTRSPMRLATAIDVMGYLVNRGVPSDTAANLMHALVQVAATDGQLFGLRDQIDADIEAGRPAAAVASVRARGLVEVLAAGLPPANGGGSGSQLPSGRSPSAKPTGTSLPSQAVGNVNAARAAGDAPADVPAPKPPARGKQQRRP